MKIAVCIPCYKVKGQIVDTVKSIPTNISQIIVVDDCCPDSSGKYLEQQVVDSRLVVLYHEKNKGVGGAMKTAYQTFLDSAECDIAIKMDGDGQMDSRLIPKFVEPIEMGLASYTKGNRFHMVEGLKNMPNTRLFGNSMLSLVNKFVSGYWHVMDPTNGFTAIHRNALKLIPIHKLENRYFFESDMLFRLGLNYTKVSDIPMQAIYAEEISNLSIKNTLVTFPTKYLKRLIKRVFYQYFLRDFNAGTIQLTFGAVLLGFGSTFGAIKWYESISENIPASAGTIMLSALPIIIGFQLLLGFLNYDIQKLN